MNRPGILRMIGPALSRRCPNCGARGVFAGWFRLRRSCPGCGLLSGTLFLVFDLVFRPHAPPGRDDHR